MKSFGAPMTLFGEPVLLSPPVTPIPRVVPPLSAIVVAAVRKMSSPADRPLASIDDPDERKSISAPSSEVDPSPCPMVKPPVGE